MLLALTLPKHEMGAYGLLITLAQVGGIVLAFGLDGAAARWRFEGTATAPSTTRFGTLAAAIVLPALAALLLDAAGDRVASSLAGVPYPSVSRLALMLAVATALTRVPIAILVSARRVREVSLLTMCAAGLPACGACIGVWCAPGDLAAVLVGQVTGAGLAAAMATASVIGEIRPGIDWRELGAQLRYGLPLVLSVLGFGALETGDRYLLQKFAGLSVVADYHLASLCGMVVSMLANSMHSAWYPACLAALGMHSNALEAHWIRIRAEARRVASGGVLAAGFIVLWGEELLRAVLPAQYAASLVLVAPIAWAKVPMMLYLLQVNVLIHHKRTLEIALLSLVSASAALALGWAWTPRWGAFGAAAAIGAGTSMVLVLTSLRAARLARSVLSARDLAMYLGGSALLTLFAVALGMYADAPQRVALKATACSAVAAALLWSGTIDAGRLRMWIPNREKPDVGR
jgi:O-antigen/teichoic acid export membrane protein